MESEIGLPSKLRSRVSKVKPRPKNTHIGSPRLPRKRYKPLCSPSQSPDTKKQDCGLSHDTPSTLPHMKETPAKLKALFINQEVCVASTPACTETEKLSSEDSQLSVTAVPLSPITQLKRKPQQRCHVYRPPVCRQQQLPFYQPLPFLPCVAIVGDRHVSRLAPYLRQWTRCNLEWFCKDSATVFECPFPRGKVDVLVVHLGGNDMDRSYSHLSPEELAYTYFHKFRDLGYLVVFIGVLARQTRWHLSSNDYRNRVWRFNTHLRRLCESGSHFTCYMTDGIDQFVAEDGVNLSFCGQQRFHMLLQNAVHLSLMWLQY